MPYQETVVRRDQHRIHVRDYPGTGPPIILMHGFPDNLHVRVRLLRELAANRESLVATHLSFPSVCHVAVDGDVFRWVPGPWEY
jgi:pimeloyl-ACP methyl ester carboxylesterase